jgi:hypothetical protein
MNNKVAAYMKARHFPVDDHEMMEKSIDDVAEIDAIIVSDPSASVDVMARRLYDILAPSVPWAEVRDDYANAIEAVAASER